MRKKKNKSSQQKEKKKQNFTKLKKKSIWLRVCVKINKRKSKVVYAIINFFISVVLRFLFAHYACILPEIFSPSSVILESKIILLLSSFS